MKKIRYLFKILLAGLVAVFILSVICSCYYFLPAHIANPNHNTDYIWPANSRWIKMTEGISWGKMDEAGYNNPKIIDNPDILILGSSQMEASNVMQDQNTCSILQKLFDGKYSVYNKGISGHAFTRICQYLPDNLEMLDVPPKYTIMESTDLWLPDQDVQNILDHSMPVQESKASGFIGTMQKIPFIRLLYKQISNGLLDLFLPGNTADETMENPSLYEEPDVKPYEDLFAFLEKTQNQYGTQIIIMYHPSAELQKDGSAVFEKPVCMEQFRRSCEKHNIVFVDMTQPFENMYAAEHRLPHGFVTGKAGYGHLNADGHNAIANELYTTIMNHEEEN